jgi:hypothetical protein
MIVQGDRKETLRLFGEAHAVSLVRTALFHAAVRQRDPARLRGMSRPKSGAAQNNPTIRPSGPMSIAFADGTFGSPGMVMISPQIATTNSAPAESRTSRTLMT